MEFTARTRIFHSLEKLISWNIFFCRSKVLSGDAGRATLKAFFFRDIQDLYNLLTHYQKFEHVKRERDECYDQSA